MGSIVVIKPGQRVPLDGVVVEGTSALDTAALTGESVPRDVVPGDAVISGCVNQTGLLRVKVTRESGESTVSKILDLVENATPLVNGMATEAQALSQDWGRFMRREVGAEEFRELARRVDGFLSRSEQENRTVASNLNDILLAQDYQDLTGQVIKRVTQLVTEVESNLLKLVLMAGQVDRFAGIEHDREAILSEKDPQKHLAKGEGPQIHADKREDVVSGQDDVDDLLSSLGF